jgi:hypothetical protein
MIHKMVLKDGSQRPELVGHRFDLNFMVMVVVQREKFRNTIYGVVIFRRFTVVPATDIRNHCLLPHTLSSSISQSIPTNVLLADTNTSVMKFFHIISLKIH